MYLPPTSTLRECKAKQILQMFLQDGCIESLKAWSPGVRLAAGRLWTFPARCA